MFTIKVLIWLALMVCAMAREIPNDAIDELSRLIDNYKKSNAGEKPQDATVVTSSSPFIIPPRTRACAESCEVQTRTCFGDADDHVARDKCGRISVKCYADCFFARKQCGECNLAFQRCSFYGSKVDFFTCWNASKRCASTCKKVSYQKRDCKGNCEAEHTQCIHVIEYPFQVHMCNNNQSDCVLTC